MKIQFKCFSCGESFNVSVENLAGKSSLACPNCENAFPQNNLEALKKLHGILVTAGEGIVVTDEIGNIVQYWDFKFVC